MNLSVIITAKNNAQTLKSCVGKILSALPEDKEVIIVVGKSKDVTEEIARSFGDKVKVLNDDVGTGSAINTGVINSSGEIIAYVEAHSLISNDYFLKVMEIFSKNQNAGYVICYRYVPDDFFHETKIQELMNIWRGMGGINKSTMGQFRAFRRTTFFDVGGFWIYPYGADDLEFATRLYSTKWEKVKISVKCYDIPRKTITSILKKQIIVGRDESIWYYAYRNHPYVDEEFNFRRKRRLFDMILPESEMLRVFINRMFKKLWYPPLFSLWKAIKIHNLAFFPFFTTCNWLYVVGYFIGYLYFGKHRYDGRIRR